MFFILNYSIKIGSIGYHYPHQNQHFFIYLFIYLVQMNVTYNFVSFIHGIITYIASSIIVE
jgi:hypothetical protein